MEMKGTTPIELSKQSGVSVNEIRRLCQDNKIASAYKYTQKSLADALGVTVKELVKGSVEMKEKILETEIRNATERLALTVRKFYPEQVYVNVSLFTHDDDTFESDPTDENDYYSITVTRTEKETESDMPLVPIISESGRIFYSEDFDGELKIREVRKYHSGDKVDDSQGRTQG